MFDYHYIEILKLAFKNNYKEQIYQTVNPADMNPPHYKVYKNTEDVKRLENTAKDLKVKKKQSVGGGKNSSEKSSTAKTRAKF